MTRCKTCGTYPDRGVCHCPEVAFAAIEELRDRVEELKKKADCFVDCAENHRLQLIVEDYVTERTKREYAAAREVLGIATGSIDPDSLEPPAETGEEG